MVFNCPKAATQHHNQQKQPYYDVTVMIREQGDNSYNGDRQKKGKNTCIYQ